jgi:circadian clock protein KaiB
MPRTRRNDRMTSEHPIHQLRLYVAGDAQNSLEARANLREICDKHLGGACELEVVDVFVQPERAMRDGIFMTPTLLKLSPGAPRTVVGTLSDIQTVLQALELPMQPS